MLLVATVPWIGKPLHIDDPADLQYVHQIIRSPFDPYGFEVDWDEGPHWAFRNYHPPLKYYYQALALIVAPESELWLHASMIPFVLLLGWAIARIATRFGCPPVLLLAFWMLGPGYLPGQNAMLDVPAMALGLAATAWMLHAVDSNRLGQLFGAGTLLGVALLTKYSTFIYLPVWIGYFIAYGRARHWLSLIMPALFFTAWCGWTKLRYGMAHPLILLDSVSGQSTSNALGRKLLMAPVFLGGAMPAAILVSCWHSRTARISSVIAALISLFVLLLAPPLRSGLSDAPQLSVVNYAMWFVLATAGSSMTILLIWSGASYGWARARCGQPLRGSHDTAMLAWWFLAAFLLGAFASPFLAMRRVVEASLPAWILLIRRAGTVARINRLPIVFALILNICIGLTVAVADYEFAIVYPRFAAELSETVRDRPSRIWCHGYWGWLYYTHSNGLRHYSLGGPALQSGDLMIAPDEVAKPATLPDGVHVKRVHRQGSIGWMPIRVMNHRAGAGYYGTEWGPLPYAWYSGPLEVFTFYEITSSRQDDELPGTEEAR